MDSILTSIKKLLGITEEYTQFDPDITIYINSVFLTLYQLGIGPNTGFEITDATTTWDEYISDNTQLLNAVKSYVYIKVRLLFDPPSMGTLTDLLKTQASELEWRMNVMVDPSAMAMYED